MASVIKKIIRIVSSATFYEPDGETYDMKKTDEIFRKMQVHKYKHDHDNSSSRAACEIEIIKDVVDLTVDKNQASVMLNKYDSIATLEHTFKYTKEHLKKLLDLFENNKDLSIIEKKYIYDDGSVEQVIEILKNITLYESNIDNPYNTYFLNHTVDDNVIDHSYIFYQNNQIEDTSDESMSKIQRFINDITKESYTKEEAYKIYITAHNMSCATVLLKKVYWNIWNYTVYNIPIRMKL